MIKRVLIYLPTLLLVGLSVFFIVTTSFGVRYWVDDFCIGGVLKRLGFLDTQISYFWGWSGRYSATFLISIFEIMGPRVVRILPVVIFTLLALSLYRPFLKNILLANIFAVLVLINAPNISQSFYWQTGAVSYFVPFIFLNIFFGIIVFAPKKFNLLLPGILLFIAGGFSEAYVLLQTVLLAFILCALKIVFPKDVKRFKIAVLGLVVSLTSLFLVYIAPGNAVRSTTIYFPPDLVDVIKMTLLGTKWYFMRMLGIKTFYLSLVVIFTSVYLFGKKYSLGIREALMMIIIAFFAGIFCTGFVIGLGFYSTSILPPERTLFVVIYTLLLCFLVISFGISHIIKRILSNKNQKFFLAGIVVLNIVAMVFLTRLVVIHWTQVRGEVEDYAIEFDKIEPMLTGSAGKKDIVIGDIGSVGELDSFTDNKGWVTGCLSTYYQIKSIKITR